VVNRFLKWALHGHYPKKKRRWSDITRRRGPLFGEFSGDLLFTPEIVPVCRDFRRLIP